MKKMKQTWKRSTNNIEHLVVSTTISFNSHKTQEFAVKIMRQREINGCEYRAGKWIQQSDSRTQLLNMTLYCPGAAEWGEGPWGSREQSWLASSVSDFLVLPDTCWNFLPLDIIRKTVYFIKFFPLSFNNCKGFSYLQSRSNIHSRCSHHLNVASDLTVTEAPMHMLTFPFPANSSAVSASFSTEAAHMLCFCTTHTIHTNQLLVCEM